VLIGGAAEGGDEGSGGAAGGERKDVFFVGLDEREVDGTEVGHGACCLCLVLCGGGLWWGPVAQYKQ